MTRVYYAVDAVTAAEKGPRAPRDVILAALLPTDLGTDALTVHDLAFEDLPDDDALVVRLRARRDAGDDAVQSLPFAVYDDGDDPDGPGKVLVHKCDPAKRIPAL